MPVQTEHASAAGECGSLDAGLSRYVDAGILACDLCDACHPVFNGLPVWSPFTTQLYDEFVRRSSCELTAPQRGWEFARREPAPGERFVQSSSSRQFLAYAASDGCTSDFAHRNDCPEIRQVFAAAGFVDIKTVDWPAINSAAHDDCMHTAGVRGRKPWQRAAGSSPDALAISSANGARG